MRKFIKNKFIQIKNKFLLKSDQKSISPKLFPIALSEKEKKFLIKHCQKCNNYLEFGSGGSTFLVLLNTAIKNITSIESDPNWISYLEKWDFIINKEKEERLKFKYINIGKVGFLGIPKDPEAKNLYPSYSNEIFKEEKNFDFVFIDGRFRVACALQTILNCNKNTTILIHDFNNREEYHCILKYLDILDTMDTMAIFKIKENINTQEILKDYETYKYNWA